MPREGQIIPEYKVPHVQTYINDNSAYTDIPAVVSETGVRFLSVFASEKGEDGVVKMIRSAAEYIDEYGTPNYELYGQPCYMPYTALQTGNARVWCMRVMPTDATYANVVILAKTKVADTTTIHASNGVNSDVANGGTTSANMANNANKIIVGGLSTSGNEKTIIVKGKEALETVTLQSDGQAFDGQWFGLIIDTGSPIVNSTYISKHDDPENPKTPITMTANDVKEAAAAGGKAYEVKQINGVETYIVAGTYEETTNEAGQPVVNYEPYTQFVQWVNVALDENGAPVDKAMTVGTETIDGVSRTVITRTVNHRDVNGVAYKYIVKFIPALVGETVADFNNFEIKYEAQSLADFNDKDTLELAIQDLAPINDEGEYETDAEGYTVIPVMGVCAKGRGEYGNSLRIRIVNDTASDEENNFKNYIVEVLDNDSSLVRKEFFRTSMYEAAVVDSTTLYANDVINDIDTGSSKICFHVNHDAFKYIYDLYNTEVGAFLDEKVQATIPSFYEFDFFFGKNKDNRAVSIPSFAIGEGLAFDATDGIALINGDDGSFAAGSFGRETAIDNAYIEAFSGTNSNINSSAILSKRRTPCEYILDANYSMNVKPALVALALRRYDAQLVLDATTNTTTIAQANRWADEMFDIADPIISKECSSYKIKDPFNGKVITVTSTHNLAKTIPDHNIIYGNHIPVVGERYSLLVDFVKNSVRPAIDADDMVVKENLYNKHVNFYECIAENRFVKGVQTTSQLTVSDLSEMNNVAVMLEMKRLLEDYVSTQIYNFAEASERTKFTTAADILFTDFANKKVQSYSVNFDMNEFEEKRNILHCYLEVQFRTMAKRGIIEIDINKRA